jgi:phosphatidylserine/phosphatidylglycerophosphate/cardiolipin synthase-like enzyme
VSRFVVLLTLCLVVGTHSAEATEATSAPAPGVAAAAGQPGTPAQKDVVTGRKRWKAPQGPYFNDPHRKKGWFRIERKVIDTIRHTRKGSTIRIAVYSFDRMPVAKALIDAHRRGVKVQMLLNDHQYTRAMRAIRKEIGAKRSRDSFIYRCKAGCRSKKNPYNNMHTKFYSFSQAGRSKDVLAVGSANMMLNADIHQWNDLYFTSGDHELFRQFVSLFNDMRIDHDTRQSPRFFCGTPVGAACDDSVDKHTVWAYPKPSGPKNDLVLDTLAKVQCLTPDGAGGQTRTRLALSMHTMRGRRGDYLAAAIRQKYAEGCRVRVSYGLIGYHTKRIIGAATSRGRIPLRSTGLDYNPDDNYDLNKDGQDDLILTYYSHQKYLAVQGTYNGVPDTHMVITGSSNWASLSTGNDEVRLSIRGKKLTRKYVKNFNYQWRNKRNSRNAYTTTYTTFRVRSTVRDEDGTTRTVWRTVRRPVTTVEPDRYRKGPYWEAD